VKHVIGKGELSEKHSAILDACHRVDWSMFLRKRELLAQLDGDRENPRYRRLQSRYFRAFGRLQEIALYYNLSAIQSEILTIGTVGFLTVSNWAQYKFIRFTQADKNRLAASKKEVVDTLFALFDQMASTVFLRECRDFHSLRVGYQIISKELVKQLADLSTWVEVKSGVPMYFRQEQIEGNTSIYPQILSNSIRVRKSPEAGDRVRLDSIRLQLFNDFSQCFIGCEPKPIGTFYIFQVSQFD
jgi:hypothetical protein